MCQFLVVNEYYVHLSFHCVKLNKGRLRCNWDYLKIWTNFRRQLSKRHVTPKINFHKNKEITQNSPETALVWFFVIFIDIFWALKLNMLALFNPKAYFHFLNVNFTLSAFYELLKRTATLSTFFSFFMMFWMHYDNVSVFLNAVVATYVHLATSSVKVTCWYVYTVTASLKFIRD